MDNSLQHSWDVNIAEAQIIQEQLRHKVITEDDLGPVQLVAASSRFRLAFFAANNYSVVSVNKVVVLTAVATTNVPELHDRIIVAAAKYLNASDKECRHL